MVSEQKERAGLAPAFSFSCNRPANTQTMIGPVLQFEDLQQLCQPGGNPRASTVERWARNQGIRFLRDGNGAPITTVDAINHVLGIRPSEGDDRMYGAADLI
jgi:cell division inhibitor SulA